MHVETGQTAERQGRPAASRADFELSTTTSAPAVSADMGKKALTIGAVGARVGVFDPTGQ
jgi:hypothetical protein